MEDVLEDDVVDVLSEEVEEEPVPHPGLVHHDLHAVGLDAAVAELEQVDTQGGGQAQRHSGEKSVKQTCRSFEQEEGTRHIKLFLFACLCQMTEDIRLLKSSYLPVDDDHAGEGAEGEHPEPEEDVDLLVEDVEGQDAERVVFLQLAARPELVEGALRQPGQWKHSSSYPLLSFRKIMPSFHFKTMT